MGLFSKKDKPIKCRLSHQEGLSGTGKGTVVDMALDDEEQAIIITKPLSKAEPKFLKYDRIKSAHFFTEKEIIEKSKSVVGRAVVGGALLGPLGAVVGGVSGVGDKKKTETEGYITITYGDEEKTIVLKIVGMSIGWSKFYDALKSKVKTEPEIQTSKYL